MIRAEDELGAGARDERDVIRLDTQYETFPRKAALDVISQCT